MKYFFMLLLILFTGLSSEERKIVIHTEIFSEEREEQGGWVSAGIQRLVTYGIEQIASVRLSEYEDMKFAYGNVKRQIPRPERERMIRDKTEMDLILKGSVRLNGSDIIVYLEMTNVRSPVRKKSFVSAGSVGKISLLRLILLEKIIQAANETAGPGFVPASFTEKEKERFLQYPEFSENGFFSYSRALSLRKTNPEESILLFSQALSGDGSIPELLIDSAVMLSRKGEYLNDSERLLNRVQEILRKNEEVITFNYIRVYYYLGVVFFNRGEFSTALEYFLKAKTMSESMNLIHTVGYLEILNYLGDIHMKKGNLNSAVEYWLSCKREYELRKMTDSIYYADLLN
ncbi:MAG TPA: tetratricopeptide repeat protein, partial [Leptospiraceae bacterium]|nr:tetratricopeptide repeat protein [Leptospiraceae bacterium]